MFSEMSKCISTWFYWKDAIYDDATALKEIVWYWYYSNVETTTGDYSTNAA